MTKRELSEQQQQVAIHHIGAPARLLAGPGTGKTYALTQRVIWLVEEQGIDPRAILVITFTRAAAHELRARISGATEDFGAPPRLSTLHAYALRQLLRNANSVETLPTPVRIADNWEVRWIIRPDLRDAMRDAGDNEATVKTVRDLFTDLSSDWETLTADEKNWETQYPNPEFLSAWREHRSIYGYTMLSELVYQLKRELYLDRNFQIESIPGHLLVDEYQDLNPCDLAVIEWLREHGAELFVAGDDDQSIYGFRNAYPLAIRQFIDGLPDGADLRLEVCRRCSPEILRLGDFVIRLDRNRVRKEVLAEDGTEPGDVRLCQFANQRVEARAIAAKCSALVAGGTEPGDILLLLRADKNGAFSGQLRKELELAALPVHVDIGGQGPLEKDAGRQFLSLLRLVVDRTDSLAWRTLLQLDTKNQIGTGAIRQILCTAVGHTATFANVLLDDALRELLPNPPRDRVRQYVAEVVDNVEFLSSALDTSSGSTDERNAQLIEALQRLVKPDRIEDEGDFEVARQEVILFATRSGASDLASLITEATSAKRDQEQVVDPNAINVLTMHKAKGLGADTVFVVAAEDQYIPGRAEGQAQIDDDRRLLYVSLTRAKRRLYITYCERRDGNQLHTGSTAGQPSRSLTRFLRDSWLRPQALEG